jgi:regulator of sirC expression with transglutaminase-like and TPR domain
MSRRFAESPEFNRLLRGDESASLTRLAFELARDAYPRLETQSYLDRIESLAARVRERCPEGAGVRHLIGQVNWVLFVEEGYKGNVADYDDPRNSYLNEVIDRRLGIPITLSVLYMAIAEAIGLELAGVNLPAHFMVRVGSGDTTRFIDPYHGGELLDREGCHRRLESITGSRVELTEDQFARCPTSAIVARMLHNLKSTYLRQMRFTEALPVLHRLAALEPRDGAELRDLGLCAIRAERPGEAVEALETYLALEPKGPGRREIQELLEVARSALARWN